MERVFNLRPDAPDLRDRLYSPMLRPLPRTYNAAPYEQQQWTARVRDQQLTSACTGFALAALVEALLPESDALSPFMLYYHARRYDDLPGEEDAGSTARAAMKAWHKHGACRLALWDRLETEPADVDPAWKPDAFSRPLGAYYRVDHCSIPDLHAAINETGVVFATAEIHEGWMRAEESGHIPYEEGALSLGGHAFLLVGYDDRGFWVQNSFGPDWGRNGFGHLSYTDWRLHSMDAWIGQLGVQISSIREDLEQGLNFARARGNDTDERGSSLLSSNAAVSAQQISPYVVNLENNGRLSDRGAFQTRPEDLHALVTRHLDEAVRQWSLEPHQPIHVALYAHGGLTNEASAAQTAQQWVPALYAQRVFPVFFMWETGVLDTLGGIAEDALRGTPGAAGAPFWARAVDWLNDRMESLLSWPGTHAWDEMKENARLATTNPSGGLRKLYEALCSPALDPIRPRLRLHLIGHSAGSIFHAHLLQALLGEQDATRRIKVDGLYFMAPACRVDLFESHILPHYRSGEVAAYTQFHLPDPLELQDDCLPLPYRRSLLYLVSNAFERGRKVPILGMEKFAAAMAAAPPAEARVWDWIASNTHAPDAPESYSTATKHGGFSANAPTRAAVLNRIARRKAVG